MKHCRAQAHGRELQACPHLNNNYIDYVNAPLPQLRWQTAIILSHNAAVMWANKPTSMARWTRPPSAIRKKPCGWLTT